MGLVPDDREIFWSERFLGGQSAHHDGGKGEPPAASEERCGQGKSDDVSENAIPRLLSIGRIRKNRGGDRSVEHKTGQQQQTRREMTRARDREPEADRRMVVQFRTGSGLQIEREFVLGAVSIDRNDMPMYVVGPG